MIARSVWDPEHIQVALQLAIFPRSTVYGNENCIESDLFIRNAQTEIVLIHCMLVPVRGSPCPLLSSKYDHIGFIQSLINMLFHHFGASYRDVVFPGIASGCYSYFLFHI